MLGHRVKAKVLIFVAKDMTSQPLRQGHGLRDSMSGTAVIVEWF